jgi:hypothetical protein
MLVVRKRLGKAKPTHQDKGNVIHDSSFRRFAPIIRGPCLSG